jgi:hypothetical protein
VVVMAVRHVLLRRRAAQDAQEPGND